MRILVVNDDGYFAPGIRHLAKVASKFGEVFVVAPDAPRSGQGHAVTLVTPLRLNELGTEEGIHYYSCNGTPADCVKLAVKVVFGGDHPDYLFSGINHGSNASSNIVYSGTVAGLIEGALAGVPSVAFSLMDHSLQADFEPVLDYVEEVIRKCIETGRKDICWSVNFPKLPKTALKGRKYYWLEGDFIRKDDAPDTDLAYTDQGYVSLTPLHFDWTDYAEMERLKGLF